MSTATYYCHDCEARRLVDWTNIASCIECGSTLLDQIPFVDEEEEDDFSEPESFFFYQTTIEEEEEDEEEERCLFEYLSSIYQQPHMEHEESISLRQLIASIEDRRELLNHLMEMLTNSEDIISSLNKVRLDMSDPGVNEECSICQEIFGTLLDVTVLPCKHRYHTECITRWLHLNTSCPICRYTLQPKEGSLEQLNRDIDDLFAQDTPTSLEDPYSSMD